MESDLIGQRFGRLIVIAPAKSKHNRARWACQCDCGRTCETAGKTLRQGKKKSCGCLRREMSQERAKLLSVSNTLPFGESAFNQLYASYKWHAAKRTFDFPLSKDEFREFTKGSCFYCGREPYQKIVVPAKTGEYLYNGLDRQNNLLGYTKTNTVSCCGVCNDMKRARSAEEFIAACVAVVNHNHKK